MTTTHDATPFPIDFDALKKGDVISKDVIADFYGVEIGDRRYPLRAMAFSERICKEMERRGRPVIVTCENDDLRVLTDKEASLYMERRFKETRRAAVTLHARAIRIDTSNIDPDRCRQHDRMLIEHAAEIAAAASARRKVMRLRPTEPPKLPPPGEPGKQTA